MASVAGTPATTQTSNQTSHVFNLPSGIQAGEWLQLAATAFGVGSMDAFNDISGWTKAIDQAVFESGFPTSFGGRLCVYVRQADGSEGSTVTMVTGGTNSCVAVTHRITDTTGLSGNGAASTSTGDGSPDPPNYTPPGGNLAYLWFAVGAAGGNGDITAAPSNYTLSGAQGSFTAAIACAYRALTASSENPGAFSDNFTVGRSVAATLAWLPGVAAAPKMHHYKMLRGS